jgi:hypothetical protein
MKEKAMWIRKIIPTNEGDRWLLLNSDNVIAIELKMNVIKIYTIASEYKYVIPMGMDAQEIVVDIWEQLHPEEEEEEQEDE